MVCPEKKKKKVKGLPTEKQCLSVSKETGESIRKVYFWLLEKKEKQKRRKLEVTNDG